MPHFGVGPVFTPSDGDEILLLEKIKIYVEH
jgi:hypothetical protein